MTGDNPTGDLRFAVIGCGVIGSQHADVISAGTGMTLSAVADVVLDRAEALADAVVARHGGPRPAVLRSVDEALARSDVDAVAICVPSGLHADLAVAALEAGRYTIIEKPVDVTVAAARRVADAAASAPNGALAAVISQHRYDLASQIVHRAIEDGRLGRITSAVASLSWWRGQAYYDSGDWRGTWALDGGGALMNQGVHTVDLLLWFLGRPVEVYAHTALLAHERVEVEDTAVATVRFANGALATVHATTAAYPGVSARVQVHGSRGSAIIDNDELTYFHAAAEGDVLAAHGVTGSGNQVEAELGGAAAGGGDLFSGQSRQYVDILRSFAAGTSPLVDVEQATLALATIRAVYLSAQRGVPVLIDDVLADKIEADTDGVTA
ncbi:Gfo/Idh/MocA family protein [Pseudonocardia sp. GCM10023141]|uniref:Gfo/Idh/MocA family protein n=1 Tax=Pseudonocardia sp. GCM10023141 TaxID=3252653 RepID=UPI00361FE56C